MNKLKNIVIVLLIIMFTISVVPKLFQNDTFFSLSLGKRILENGIENQEKLVWHEGMEFVNPRWLFDIGITQIYNLFDFQGIYIFVLIMSSIQAIMYYLILRKITQKPILSCVFTLLMVYFSSLEFAARSQIISFNLFLIEFYAIEELLKTNKKRYFVILSIIPFLLVNIHASVYPMCLLMYLPYIAEYILSKLKITKKEDSKIIIKDRNINKIVVLLIVAVLAGFCSIKGLGAHTYMFKTMIGVPDNMIMEMNKVHVLENAYLTIMICIALGIIMFTKTKLLATDGFFIIGFLFISLNAERGLFYFYLISTICIVRIINDFLDGYDVKFNFMKSKKVKSVIAMLYIIFMLVSIEGFSTRLCSHYVSNICYPVDATTYILDNIDISKMKLYNSFNVGSYLEFNKIPTFIDSRAELYTSQFNEGCTILNEYYDTIYGLVNYRTLFEKYGITHALLENDGLINRYICYDDDWKLLYKDGTFSLYEKINNNQVQ